MIKLHFFSTFLNTNRYLWSGFINAAGENPDEIAIDDFDGEDEPIAKGDPVLPLAAENNLDVSKSNPDDLLANPDEILLEEELDEVVKPPSPPKSTKFLALDKCLPRRQFLEVWYGFSGASGHRFTIGFTDR